MSQSTISTILLDGAVFAEHVPPELLQGYLLEQMRLHGWQLVAYDYASEPRIIEVMDRSGELRTLAIHDPAAQTTLENAA